MNDRAQEAAVDLRRVEEIGLNALQTQQQLFYDGWLLRLSPGKAKRARSVNAFFGSTLPLARKIAYCERVYADHGLPLLFRITPFVQPAGLEPALIARGYEPFETTNVQVAPLAAPAGRGTGRRGDARGAGARRIRRRGGHRCRTRPPSSAPPIASGSRARDCARAR